MEVLLPLITGSGNSKSNSEIVSTASCCSGSLTNELIFLRLKFLAQIFKSLLIKKISGFCLAVAHCQAGPHYVDMAGFAMRSRNRTVCTSSLPACLLVGQRLMTIKRYGLLGIVKPGRASGI